MAGNSFRHQVEFEEDGEVATLRLPVAYDVIQIQFHVTGTADDTDIVTGKHTNGDLMLIQGLDEDGDLITLPGGISEHATTAQSGAFKLHVSDAKILQFSWKGPAIKLTWIKDTATSVVVKVKTFMEGVGDVDTGSPYPTILDADLSPVRSLRG